MDRRIFANMGPDALWVKLQPCIQDVMNTYTDGKEMMERFDDVVKHARRIIQGACRQNGVAPHDCVCALYCLMAKSYFSVPKLQVMLMGMVKAEMELMTEAYNAKTAETERVQKGRIIVFHPPTAPTRIEITNHHYPPIPRPDEPPTSRVEVNNRRLEEIERRLDELSEVIKGGKPRADDDLQDLFKALSGR